MSGAAASPDGDLAQALHALRGSLNNAHLQLVLAERDLANQQDTCEHALRRIGLASKQIAAAVACLADLEATVPRS
jgi:hypothetical protein